MWLIPRSYLHARTLLTPRKVWPAEARFRVNAGPPFRESSSTSDGLFTDVPLVFLHGMKGSHLAFKTTERASLLRSIRPLLDWNPQTERRKRAWLTLPALLNFPPRSDDEPHRDISLPLTYSECKTIQDRGPLVVDGTVNHIVELGSSGASLALLPFYGHVTKHLQEIDARYRGDNVTVGDAGSEDEKTHPFHVRPTRNYAYDWRRSLPELAEEFHAFCEREFPGTPVQVLGHSMGGLIAFAAMRNHPDKYRPGAVLVGVPFGTGVQYLQDLHWGYFTELGRCRQFLPTTQFSFSSHWSFFPVSEKEVGDSFVDVTDRPDTPFLVNQSAIGKPGTTFQDALPGERIDIDFYDVSEWEQHEIGIFDPSVGLDNGTLDLYRDHMRIQLQFAKEWRNTSLQEGTTSDLPPLVVCSTNTIPTVNQILRRRRRPHINGDTEEPGQNCAWEYDYVSGRSVPGDGRIDFDKSFPPKGTSYKKVRLDSMHAKQMCWNETGGSLDTIWEEVTEQIEKHR